MKKEILFFITFLLGSWLSAQESSTDSIKLVNLNEVAVMAQRPINQSSVISKTISIDDIKVQNVANNLPDIIKYMPSVVTYNEGGTPVGNTFYTIRGASANRINVTLNGMPMTNPESQEMYWVNLPNIGESLRSIQVQRGVGTSVAGSSSFGGNISLETNFNANKPFLDIASTIGQYKTFTQNIALGTGLINDKYSFDLRFSHVKSDGYIRNGKVNHYNINAGFSYYLKNSLFKLIYIHGIQHTGITWEGVSAEELKKYGRRYNPAGKYIDDKGQEAYYKNETDNYYSHIIQAIYSISVNNRLTVNSNIGYNNGYGYYENYKTDQELKSYNLGTQEVNNKLYTNSDLILRKLMRNDYYYINTFANYRLNKWNILVGANFGYFDGDHYGKLKWVKFNQDIPKNYEWYRNRSKKGDFNIFAKASFNLTNKLMLEAELHGRFINYKMNGPDDDLMILNNDLNYNFFNPKFGLTYLLSPQQRVYGSISIAHREPQREDLKESSKNNGKLIKPEKLTDIELGYTYSSSQLNFSINGYYMKYKDQLVQTGQLSSVGYKFQQNVPNSYRLGIELDMNYQILPYLWLGGNMTLSKNKIKNFTAYFDVYNNPEEYKYESQKSIFFKETTIGFSPSVVSSVYATIKPIKNMNLIWSGKYIGKMYFDNTQNKSNQLSDYFVSSFNASYSIFLDKIIKQIDIQFVVNNLFNKKYIANAWTETVYFSQLDDKEVTYRGFYPQAERNFLAQIRLSF